MQTQFFAIKYIVNEYVQIAQIQRFGLGYIHPIKLQNFYQSTTSKVNRIPGRSLFVRTGWPDHSNCKENSTVNQDYPATSVYS